MLVISILKRKTLYIPSKRVTVNDILFQNCNYSWCPEPHGCFKRRQEYSLYILSPENYIRRIAFHVIAQRWFDNTVLFFIALNCITLAMERPDIPPDSTVSQSSSLEINQFTCIQMCKSFNRCCFCIEWLIIVFHLSLCFLACYMFNFHIVPFYLFQERYILTISNNIFTTIFTLEMTIKVRSTSVLSLSCKQTFLIG